MSQSPLAYAGHLGSTRVPPRDSLFVGEYVFTAFQSGKYVFVLLSRGQLGAEDVDWTALLLTAAESTLARAPARPAPTRGVGTKSDSEKGFAERDARLYAKEKDLAELEARLQAEAANLTGRQEELDRQKARLAALADYSARIQDTVATGLSRSRKELETAHQLAANSSAESNTRAAEEEKTRREIESRVADLSQRFTSIAKERLVSSHGPGEESSDEVRKAMEGEKAEVARERKFLQRRAIELLDREDRVRDREGHVDEREQDFARREQELSSRQQDLERQRTLLAQAKPQPPEVRTEPDEAKRDIERRVKIIQQKALELLDREEKLRKRAAELEAMEARLSRDVTAE